MIALRDVEAFFVSKESEIESVVTGHHIRLELNGVVVHDDVTGLPEIRRKISINGFVIEILPTTFSVHMNEQLPIVTWRIGHFENEP
jgi:hypothetical protein